MCSANYWRIRIDTYNTLQVSNRQVEWYNQHMSNFLRCFLQGKQCCWDEYLPMLWMALRTTVNYSTGFTPNILQLGYEVNMLVEILLWLSWSEELPQSQDHYLKALSWREEVNLGQTASTSFKPSYITPNEYCNLKAWSQWFAEGDLISNAKHVCHASPLFVSPFIIKSILPNDLYQVEGQRTEGKETVHHNSLLNCEDRVIQVWVCYRKHQEECDILRCSTGCNRTVVYKRDQKFLPTYFSSHSYVLKFT